jgi:hypothetical protein
MDPRRRPDGELQDETSLFTYHGRREEAFTTINALFVRRARNVSLVRKLAENTDICKQKKQDQILGLKSILI